MLNQRENIEYVFLKLVLVFGLLFIFLIPPFQVADEDSHFKKSYLISNFHWFPTEVNGVSGNYFPKAILEFENNHRYMIGQTDQKYSYGQLYANSAPINNYGENIFTGYSTSNTHPLLYFPQTISIWIAKFFINLINHDLITPSFYMYAGRTGNLLFYALCLFFAIKIIPFYKRVLLLIGLLPMSLTLASSMSYDVMVIGVAVLLISTIFYFAYDNAVENIGWKKVLILMLFSIILIELKQVYYPLLCLFFLIPSRKFESLKKRIISFLVIISSGILTHLIWILISKITVAASGDSNNHALAQITFIINNPFEYIAVVFRTFKVSGFFYLNSFIGNLGWLDTNFPVLFVCGLFIYLCLVSLLDSTATIKLNKIDRLIILLIGLGIIFLIETSLYVIWTSIPEIGGIGYHIVSGVQGRYFIPISLLLLAMLYFSFVRTNQFLEKARQVVLRSVPTVVLYSCVLTTFILLIRYWIPN